MLNPLLLWFLPLALVPIILHLITLYRVKTVELSTFRFLMDSYVQKRRRIKLLEYILMILRTLFVALVVLALSRPVVEKFGWMGTQSGKDVTIIIDTSIAMNLRTDSTTSLDRAKSAAESIVGLLAADDQITLIAASKKPTVLSRGFASESRSLKQKIHDIEGTSTGSSMAAAIESVVDSPPRGPRVVYLLSDLNRHAWSELQGHPATKRLIMDHDTRVVVMNLAPSRPVKNMAVVGEAPEQIHSIAGLPLRLTASVLNTSSEESSDAVLSVIVDDQQAQRLPFSVRAGQKVSQGLIINPSHPGIIRGKFQLPSDAFTQDDTMNFVLNIDPTINVVLLTPPPIPQTGGLPPEKADTFVHAALLAPLDADSNAEAKGVTPAAAPGAPKTDVAAIASSLKVTSIPFQSLDDATLANADVVIMLNIPLNPDLGNKLRKYANSGGGIIVLPGENVVPGDYRTYLFAKNAAEVGSVSTPVAYDAPEGEPNDESTFQPVTGLDLKSPVMAAFGGDRTDYFATTRIFRYFPINTTPTLADVKAEAAAVDTSTHPESRPQVLMRLFDRRPLMVETQLGLGRLILAGFAPTPRWSNLPVKPEFVPLILRMVAEARRPAPAECENSITPGQAATLKLTDRWPQAHVDLIDPLGKSTPVDLFRNGKIMTGGTTETQTPGVYVFRVLPRAVGAPDSLEIGFAVNPEIAQSDFTSMTEGEVRGSFAPMDVQYLRGTTDDPLLKEQLTNKSELWKFLIYFMFAVIGVEFVLSTLGAGITESPNQNTLTVRPPWYRRVSDMLTGAQ